KRRPDVEAERRKERQPDHGRAGDGMPKRGGAIVPARPRARKLVGTDKKPKEDHTENVREEEQDAGEHSGRGRRQRMALAPPDPPGGEHQGKADAVEEVDEA